MKIIKKGLDELQKQILLGIESRGFWIAFWGSLILLIVQMIFANNIISVISSWLLFMVLAIYEAVSCLKAGIWNSSLYISKKRNAFISSIIAICMGVFQFILVSQRGESTYKTIIVLVSVIAYITAAWCGEPETDMELAARYCRMAYEAGFSPTLTGANATLLAYANKKIEDLDSRRKTLSKAIADLSVETLSSQQIELLSGYLDDWEHISFEDKRKAADGLISSISATSDYVKIEWKI